MNGAPSACHEANAPLARTLATVVTGADGAAREAAIAADLAGFLAAFQTDPHLTVVPAARPVAAAILLEGLPDGQPILLPSDQVSIQRIAPACLCCTGNLVLRVTLNRILRHRPQRLYIGAATTDHLDQLRSWLRSPPYDQLLELTPDLCG